MWNVRFFLFIGQQYRTILKISDYNQLMKDHL